MNDDVLNALELLQKVNTDLSYDMICKTSDEQKVEYHKKLETFLKYNSMKAKDANAPRNLNGLKGKSLEELATYLLKISGDLFEVKQNLRTTTNEIDQVFIPTQKAKVLIANGIIDKHYELFLGECKNYNKSVDIRNGYVYDIPQKKYENLKQTGGEENIGIGLMAYRRFADGKERKKAADRLLRKADAIIRNARRKKTADEQIGYVHDFLIRHTTYLKTRKNEEKELTQSVFSALCRKKSVCAGYSRAFAMLCNGLGYQTVCVTGGTDPGHMWNMTYVKKNWYNFDVTWDDLDVDGVICTDWFARSDRVFLKSSGKENHVPEEFLKKYVSKAAKDRKNEEKI